MRILCVDDDEISLAILEKAFTADGHEVETARNGREALDVLRLNGCRLIISDWDMPVMNGIELCQAIRAEGGSGYIYFILLTSHDTRQDAVAGLTAGADDFISKPFHPAELQARIRAGERVLSLETRDMVIFALAKLAESRDQDTGAHLERVRCYARALAQQLRTNPKYECVIGNKFIQLIYLTSPLHDIGKVGIPDSVLLKPGRLTPEEFEVMKTHAALGAETLDAALRAYPNADFLEMARDIAVSHHERFDGGGYPAGLRGEEIPLCGRLVALADVYDALTSRRVYKDAFTHQTARSMILEESGSHFDPDIVDAFLECEREFLEIRERYAESSPALT
jgi:putative two-component system response regulator